MATKAKTVKKATKKVAKKTPKKKTPKKKTGNGTLAKKVKKKKGAIKSKPTKEKAVKKSGLPKPQVRILQALAKANKGLNRKEISSKGKVDLAMLNSYIGSHNEERRKKGDESRGKPCLLTAKLVAYTASENPDGKGVYYKITKAGEAALAKATA